VNKPSSLAVNIMLKRLANTKIKLAPNVIHEQGKQEGREAKKTQSTRADDEKTTKKTRKPPERIQPKKCERGESLA
jgi:hypothetical protein